MTRALMLGVESSCDDTAAAVVTEDGLVLSSVVSSQMEAAERFGGVVPELASRVHAAEVVPVITRALDQAGVTPDDLTAIAVTRGPGLSGSLLVGVSAAKAFAMAWNKPIVGVNHLEGHLASASLGEHPVVYPALVLLVSGGHCLLARLEAPGVQRVLGQTRDDSAGEAYDKVARILGLGFPGGPVIDRLAKQGTDTLGFPRPMLNKGLEFSFSGLKTAVSSYVKQNPDYVLEEVCASFAAAVMDVLIAKVERALSLDDYASVAVVGGVAASPVLRGRMAELSERTGVTVCMPPMKLATDNGAMIAAAGWPIFRESGGHGLEFPANPRLKLPES